MMSLLIGRHPACDIVLADPTVSRQHATVVEIASGEYLIRDEKSSCGTFVMQAAAWTRIETAQVGAADRIRLGAYEATVERLLRLASPVSNRQVQRVERDPESGEVIVRSS